MRLTDWRGNEYGPGDRVIYAAMSGRCVTMVEADVIEIWRVYRNEDWEWERLPVESLVPDDKTELRVALQPVNSSRWKQHSGRTRYIDSRTGKGIDPFRGRKHIKDGTGINVCDRTGTALDDENCAPCCTGPLRYGKDRHWHSRYPVHPGDPKLAWIDTEFQPWVEKKHEATKRVTLTVTENITLLESRRVPIPGIDVPSVCPEGA